MLRILRIEWEQCDKDKRSYTETKLQKFCEQYGGYLSNNGQILVTECLEKSNPYLVLKSICVNNQISIWEDPFLTLRHEKII